jgi:hypothetical protein
MEGSYAIAHPGHRDCAQRGAAALTGARQRLRKERLRDPAAAIARANIEPQRVGFIPGIEANGHRPREGVTVEGDVRRAKWGAYKRCELHELAFDVIKSGASAAMFCLALDVFAVLQPELAHGGIADGRVGLHDADSHASPMAAGSPVALAA